MNKKEIAEIKKTMSIERMCLDQISACYVNADKEMTMIDDKKFLSLPEEEIFKYLEIFKKAFSGKLDKNLFNISIKATTDEKSREKQDFLIKLKSDQKNLHETLFTQIIESYPYPENYCIILVHGTYDVPGAKDVDGFADDVSETVYEHILCCICPVKQEKAALCYDDQSIIDKTGAKRIELPISAFLYPAFNDRAADVHEALYYAKKYEEKDDILLDAVFASMPKIPAEKQKEYFNQIFEECIGDKNTFDTVKSFQEDLETRMEEKGDLSAPLSLDKEDLFQMIGDAADIEIDENKFDNMYDDMFGKEKINAEHLAEKNMMEIKGHDILIRVKNTTKGMVEQQMVNGKLCYVIPVEEGMTVNGVSIKAESKK